MPNKLTIYKNNIKTNSKQPDLRGYIVIEQPLEAGKYEVGLYPQVSKNGQKYYSGIIRPRVIKTKNIYND